MGGVLVLPFLYFLYHNDMYLARHLRHSLRVGIVWFSMLLSVIFLGWIFPGTLSCVLGTVFLFFDVLMCVSMTISLLRAMVGDYWTPYLSFRRFLKSSPRRMSPMV